VQQALNRLMKNRTTIIIAHRLSTIAEVDKIVTIVNGEVDEIGTPSDLAKSGGLYAKLLSLQRRLNVSDKEKLTKFGIDG
jgi:ATP-binding cassette subfamily B protein